MGFTADEFVIYNLKKNNPSDYLTEFERYRLRLRLRESRILMDNKVIFNQLLSNFAPVNKIFAYKKGNQIVPLCPEWKRYESPLDFIMNQSVVCFKKIFGGGGEGFHLLGFDEKNFLMDKTICSADQINSLLSDSKDWLLEEYCKQSEFANSLFAGSLNTLRIITILDADDKPTVLAALMRMGANESVCVDNASQGGVFSDIDIQTGQMYAAICSYSAQWLRTSGNDINTYSTHPITGAPIEGVIIPDWEIIKSQIQSFHEHLLYTGVSFIAWDIALTDDGIRIVEGNTSCGLGLLQRRGGQRHKALGDYYRRMGIIK